MLDLGYNIVEVAGTSGGSIVAAAVACGHNKDELYQLAVESDMSDLLVLNPTSLFNGAYCNGNNLYSWLDVAFSKKKLKDVPIPIKILSTDVKAGSSFEFSSIDTPDVPLALACRASSAVPFVYAPVIYNGRFLADGGMVNNIPVDKLTIDKTSIRIGIDVDDQSEYKTSPIWAYAGSLVSLLLQAGESTLMHMEESTGAMIIKVPCGDAFFLDTHMSIEAKKKLFDAGYAATTKALTS